jgi:hypothetical protein
MIKNLAFYKSSWLTGARLQTRPSRLNPESRIVKSEALIVAESFERAFGILPSTFNVLIKVSTKAVSSPIC